MFQNLGRVEHGSLFLLCFCLVNHSIEFTESIEISIVARRRAKKNCIRSDIDDEI